MTHRNPYGLGSHFTGLCETQRALWIAVDGLGHPLEQEAASSMFMELWSPFNDIVLPWALWCNLEASGKLLESAWQQAATGGRLRLRKLQRPEIKILVGQMES